jgi:uncharacterized membrane protein
VNGEAFALALGAAVLHAGWNVLLAGSRDSVAATGALLALGALLLAPATLLTGAGVSSAALPFVAASAALELAYFVMLPSLPRGSCCSPFAARPNRDCFSASPSVWPSPARRWSDSEGHDHADPLAYLFLVAAVCAVAYCGGLVATGQGGEPRKALNPRSLLTAAAVFGAYAMVLAALELAPSASVAAVRESSVVIAAGFAWRFLGEPRRLTAAVLVAAGVATIALA